MTEYGARCPDCHISFRITGAQRRAAGGLVRCGFCLAPFDANAHGVALAPEPLPVGPPWLRPDADRGIDADPLTPSPTTAMAPQCDAIASIPAPPQPVEPEPESEARETAPRDDGVAHSSLLPPGTTAPALTDPVPDAIADAVPAPATPAWLQPRAAPARTRAAAAIVITALVTLLLQGLYFHADRLDQRPELRGVYRSLCGVVPCRRPAYRDLAAIAVDQLVVRNPAPGALRLDAMLTNRGREAQALPNVRLRFESLQGTVVAERRFAPAEYLDQSAAGTLAVGQSLHLVLELVDPGPEAVSYALAPVD